MHAWLCSVIRGGELLVGMADEEELVDKAGDSTADQWAKPVDPVVVPGPAHHGGSESHSRVHGGSVEGPTSQNVGTNYETDGQGCDGSQTALLGVNGRSVHCVHQPKGHHDLQNDGVPHPNPCQAESWDRLPTKNPTKT